MINKNIKLGFAIFLALAFNFSIVSAAVSFQVTTFSCSPSESAINSVFSCTAQIRNVGDASGSVSTATLYPDATNWLEDSNYPQASGTSVSPGQTTEITFTGLRAIRSGNNGFSKIMLDSVTDTYVADNNIKVNIIDVVVTVNNSVSSAAMNSAFDSTSEVTAGGNIDVTLTFTIDSGGCSIGSEPSQKSISGMQDGNKQSRTWAVTQGTSGNCRYTISAAATGSGGAASKTDSTSSSVTCTDCPVASSSSSSSGGSGAGGGGGASITLGELKGSQTKEISKNGKISFNISNSEHFLTLVDFTDTTATITLESEKQTFTLTIGDIKNIDLNSDGFAEISVQLKSINSITKKVTFVLTRLSGNIPADKSAEQEAGGEEPKKSLDEGLFKIGSGINIYLIIGILVAAIIIVAIIVVIKFIKHKQK